MTWGLTLGFCRVNVSVRVWWGSDCWVARAEAVTWGLMLGVRRVDVSVRVWRGSGSCRAVAMTYMKIQSGLFSRAHVIKMGSGAHLFREEAIPAAHRSPQS